MTDRPGVTDHSACTQVGVRPLRWSAVVVSRGLKASAMDSTPHPRSTRTGLAAAVCAILGASLLAMGAVLMKPVESSGISARIDGANGSIDPYQESNMKTLHPFRTAGALGVLAVTQIALVSGASAQATAVQWNVADGGNGHWYQVMVATTSISWFEANERSGSLGGHLATLTTTEENVWVHAITVNASGAWGSNGHPFWTFGPWIGGHRDSSDNQIWVWVTGEPWSFTAWHPSQPDSNAQTVISFGGGGPTAATWADTFTDEPVRSYIIEWSADCNADSIVDYGQCLNGTLPDYNSNNVPDCCERGEVCVAGNYPVQWRVNDGGNGHWYQGVATQTAVSWTSARARAIALGSQLAAIGSRAEDDFVARLALENPMVWPITVGYGPWLGGYQASPSTDPFANWVWVTGEPWSYVSDVVLFDNSSRPDGQTDDYLHYINHSRVWNDVRNDGDTYYNSIGIRAYMAEWSADCNSDGIVDYGQILTGQLVDMNTTGIPDICEQPPCQDSDITNNHVVDGADLGALLAFWGPVNPVLPQADINRDGDVNGADLGLLLTNWGPCGQ